MLCMLNVEIHVLLCSMDMGARGLILGRWISGYTSFQKNQMHGYILVFYINK
jgi:hypothetical protein